MPISPNLRFIGDMSFEPRESAWTARREFLHLAAHVSAGSPLRLDVMIYPGSTQPTPEQRQAIDFFLANEERVCANLLDAIFRYYHHAQQSVPEWYEQCHCHRSIR
jgi:hypothetical protein